jgi:hypothetical protein
MSIHVGGGEHKKSTNFLRKQIFPCRVYRVLIMVYNTTNFWVFGIHPLFDILKKNTKEHNILETGFFHYGMNGPVN